MNATPTKACTQCGITKPFDAYAKWIRDPSGYRVACKQCVNEHSRALYKSNPEKSKQRTAAWLTEDRKRHPDKYREKYLLQDSEKKYEQSRNWYARNVSAQRARMLDRYHRMPGAYRELSVRRQARSHQATPSWLTEEQRLEMRAIYLEAKRLSAMSGVKYHVDHIVPLRGKEVSGLHVPWNLRIIAARENLSKGNRLNGAVLAMLEMST